MASRTPPITAAAPATPRPSSPQQRCPQGVMAQPRSALAPERREQLPQGALTQAPLGRPVLWGAGAWGGGLAPPSSARGSGLLDGARSCPDVGPHPSSPPVPGRQGWVCPRGPRGWSLTVPATARPPGDGALGRRRRGGGRCLWSLAVPSASSGASSPASRQQVVLGCGHRVFLLQLCRNWSLQKLLQASESAPLT